MKSILTFLKRHPVSVITICIGIVISIASRNILPLILFGVLFGGEYFVLEWFARNSIIESRARREEMRRRKAAKKLQKEIYSKKY